MDRSHGSRSTAREVSRSCGRTKPALSSATSASRTQKLIAILAAAAGHLGRTCQDICLQLARYDSSPTCVLEIKKARTIADLFYSTINFLTLLRLRTLLLPARDVAAGSAGSARTPNAASPYRIPLRVPSPSDRPADVRGIQSPRFRASASP